MELTSVHQSRPPEVKSTQHKQNTALTIKEQDVIHCNLLLITESPRQITTEQLFFAHVSRCSTNRKIHIEIQHANQKKMGRHGRGIFKMGLRILRTERAKQTLPALKEGQCWLSQHTAGSRAVRVLSESMYP